jgi:hypothetical protein
MIEVTEAGKVIYKTEHNAVGRFPEPGDEELLAGPSRNFQIFAGTILPRFALNGYTWSGTLQPRRKSKCLSVSPAAEVAFFRRLPHPVELTMFNSTP